MDARPMEDRDYPRVDDEQTDHERRVTEVEETERGGDVADPVAGADRRPTAEEDLAADREDEVRP